jgi:hypothetical protein
MSLTSLARSVAVNWGRHALVGLACGALLACSPSHNWRQVRHDTAPGQLLLPCKPDRAERQVPLMGPEAPPLVLSMLSCEVGSHTFAWGVVRLPEGTPAATVLEAWQQAGWVSLRQPVPAGQAWPAGWQRLAVAVPGAQQAERWQGPGLNHRGHPLSAHIQWAWGDGWLHQVALYGPDPGPELRNSLWESLDLRAPLVGGRPGP